MADGSSDFKRGLQLRRKLLGSEWVDGAMERASSHPLGPDFQEMVTEHLFGRVWAREGAPLKSRIIVAIAILAYRGQSRELANYMSVALDNGMDIAELREVLLQITAYGGFPAGQGAFSVALDVIDARTTT
ncbi:carboxymuconolactone decarboxylase family protein [Roseobacter sp. YSTF-M11]|uniref:Carboxymuconolactone decarboxylase family protein n=1 Tax=Roseobacter insulae TaxID=2859783 RepID=A0A9X1FRF3_9RHOB|nr:carboxymuconolactone decarboxylase family protein [Roseobacter insulae]MBW4706355.1 carboxymuconolactone decarboxylase family protein [Roseobacter insulae]